MYLGPPAIVEYSKSAHLRRKSGRFLFSGKFAVPKREKINGSKNLLKRRREPITPNMPQKRNVSKTWNLLTSAASGALGLSARGIRLGGLLLLLFALLLGAASSAQAAGDMCSDYPGGVIDGNTLNISQLPSTLGIDRDCTIKNFPQSVGGLPFTLINFQFPNHASYLIVFDNVFYDGNMSCNDPTQSTFSMWWSNGSYNNISTSCQEFIIPVDGIHKENPAGRTTATIGVPFTYTLTFSDMATLTPSGYVYSGSPDTADLYNIEITDDLTATGANLTYLSNTAYLKNSDGTTTALGSLANSGDNKHLVFSYVDNASFARIPANSQVVLKLTVVLDDTPANVPGTQFINTAHWELGRIINGTQYEPLPGQDGITPPMTIVGPNLVVNKTSSETALNLGVPAAFTIDVENTGGSDAWNATILDQLPDGPQGGMCDYDPTTAPGGVTARIAAADGTLVSDLTQGTDYSVTYSGAPTCQLSLTLLDTPTAKVGPSQHLIINYQSQLDGDSKDGITLTNVAGATRWFSGDSSLTSRRQYDKGPLTDGTPGVADFQDSETITTALAGYYFQKTVENLTSGANPAVTAAPGDRLRYRLRLFNVDQTIDGITISDLLDPNRFDLTTFAMVTPPPAGAKYTFDPASGRLEISGDITPLNVAVGSELVIEFEITLKSTLTNGTAVDNQATLTAAGLTAESDDPYVNGIAPPGAPADPTRVVIQSPGPLAKANSQASATIGEQFKYRITVPATPTAVPLYDVRILDDLGLAAANMRFVSANVVSGGTWALSNAGSATNLIIEDTATGIDIPANGQAVIEITGELHEHHHQPEWPALQKQRVLHLQPDERQRRDANGRRRGHHPRHAGGRAGHHRGQQDGAIRHAGEQTGHRSCRGRRRPRVCVTIPNSGNSTAFDTDIVDTLPVNVSLVPGSATARIGGVPVSGFVADPTQLPGGGLAWGRQNGDDTLDIPAGQSLALTYRATVVSVNGLPINNSAYVDWTSLDGASTDERTGAGCPTADPLNDYCFGPVTAAVATTDTTTVAKSVVSDSWDSGASTGTDSILRVGDSVVYRLALTLREGQLQNVVVTDSLPAGLAFDGVVSVNGDATAPFSAAGAFSYADIPAANVPAPGQTGTLTWQLGDINNAIDHDAGNDTLVIEYRARVAKDTLAQTASTTLTNSVALSYTGNDPAAARLHSSAVITVRQPVMSTPTKTATGFTSPANVNILSDVMPFHLQSCNNGSAPAYSAKFTDVLASQMNEAGMSVPVVTVGSTVLTAGTDYVYAYTPLDRTMTFVLNTPVNPTECATIDYTIGLRPDVGPNQTWNNSTTLDEYWSLAAPTTTGQKYGPLSSTPFIMTNPVAVQPLAKSVVSPASGEVTIGEEAVYRITVPRVAVNAALSNVVVTDTLNGALEYAGATAVDNGGNPVTLTDNSVAPGNVNLTIAQIPAGKQVIITLHTRVADNTTANAGVSFTNTASYTYTGIPAGAATDATSGPLTIVEPLINLTKSVAPTTAPKAGDTLTYTVNLQAQGGTDKSEAFDTGVVDALSLGLTYEPGSATVGGVAVDPAVSGDGITTPQTLTWSGIDIPEGTTVQVIYKVRVLDSVGAGQSLTNSVTARWTSLSGPSTDERDGSGTPAWNDYFATAATSLTVGDNTALAKTYVSDTYHDGSSNVRVGDLIDYELRLGLQEGTTTGVVLTDILPAGMAYDSLASITPASGSSNFTYNLASQPAAGATGTLTWNLGTVVNASDNDPANDTLVIRYRARVLNNHVLAQTPTTQTLTNNATLGYTIGGVPATPKSASQSLYVLQPMLAVTKSAAPAGGDAVIGAGETISYTVDITNSGAAPAYDTVLTDTLPVGLRQGGVTTTSITLVTCRSHPAEPAPGLQRGHGCCDLEPR